MPVRYTKSPPSDRPLTTFLDRELQRIENALRNIDADSINVKNSGSQIAAQLVLQAPGTASFTPPLFAGVSPFEVIQDAGASVFAALSMDKYAASPTLPPFLNFRKSNSSTMGTQGAVQIGDFLGIMSFQGSDGFVFRESARIASTVLVAATAGSGAVSGLNFFVTSPGAPNTFNEIARIQDDATNFGNFILWDAAGNFQARIGQVNTHGGAALAALGGATYSLVYFYSQNFGVVRGYIGASNTVMEVNNAVTSQELQLQTRDNTATQRSNIRLGGNFSASALAFHGTAPIVKPTATGAKGGNAALASICTILANYGLIVDSTT